MAAKSERGGPGQISPFPSRPVPNPGRRRFSRPASSFAGRGCWRLGALDLNFEAHDFDDVSVMKMLGASSAHPERMVAKVTPETESY